MVRSGIGSAAGKFPWGARLCAACLSRPGCGDPAGGGSPFGKISCPLSSPPPHLVLVRLDVSRLWGFIRARLEQGLRCDRAMFAQGKLPVRPVGFLNGRKLLRGAEVVSCAGRALLLQQPCAELPRVCFRVWNGVNLKSTAERQRWIHTELCRGVFLCGH